MICSSAVFTLWDQASLPPARERALRARAKIRWRSAKAAEPCFLPCASSQPSKHGVRRMNWRWSRQEFFLELRQRRAGLRVRLAGAGCFRSEEKMTASEAPNIGKWRRDKIKNRADASSPTRAFLSLEPFQKEQGYFFRFRPPSDHSVQTGGSPPHIVQRGSFSSSWILSTTLRLSLPSSRQLCPHQQTPQTMRKSIAMASTVPTQSDNVSPFPVPVMKHLRSQG